MALPAFLACQSVRDYIERAIAEMATKWAATAVEDWADACMRSIQMVENTLPRAPVEHWEQERADWILAVSQLVDEIEQWAARRGW